MNYFYSYNSLSHKIEKFPLENLFKIYVCGVTVYDDLHLGHIRGFIFYDFLRRLLEYNNRRVIFVRNITDVDDKIYNKCPDGNINTFTEKYINSMNKLQNLLNILPPHYQPKVTQNIETIKEYIEDIIEKGYAYTLDDGIYLDTSKIKYGLFEKKENTMSRVQHNPFKKSISDFAIWKFNSQQGFHYKRGYGRPGWHIECSAMSQKILGDVFHIHGGGCDLIFPHHENEIAQSMAAKNKIPAKLWLHHEMVNINQEKMSKSAKNFITAKTIVTDSLQGDYIRYFFLKHHYRSKVSFNMKNFHNIKQNVTSIRKFYFKHLHTSKKKLPIIGNMNYLFNDFNTSEAICAINKAMTDYDVDLFFSLNSILGFKHENLCKLSLQHINNKIQERTKARNIGNFLLADQIRQYLKDNFVELNDKNNQTKWFFI